MNPRAIKSGFLGKGGALCQLMREEGLAGGLSRVRDYLRYHLKEKWRFVYLAFPLDQELFPIKLKGTLKVRTAGPEDQEQIETDLFPRSEGLLSYDKRYLGLLGQPDVRCFVAEKNGRLVHYSWLFMNAMESPLRETPFDVERIEPGDAYVGPIFTDPSARGFIYPQVLPEIIRFAKRDHSARRVLVLVQGKNQSAVGFYKKMGFQEIGDAHAGGPINHILKKLKRLVKLK